MAYPVTDFANFATLPPLMRQAEVRMFNSFFPKYNYRPLRKVYADILRTSSFGDFCERPDFSVILEKLISVTKNVKPENRPKQLKLNLYAARALYDFSLEYDVHCISETFGKFLYTQNGGIKPFEEAVVFIAGEPHIVFFDFRKSNYLTPDGRKFIFSVMHHHIRSRYPDLSDVRLSILHLQGTGKKRHVNEITFSNSGLFSLDQLEQMVADLYYDIELAA
jgi:hypothetical protein